MVRCLSGYELVRLNIALRQRHNEEPAQLILFLLLLLIPIFLDHHPEQEQEKEKEKEKDLFGYAIVLQTNRREQCYSRRFFPSPTKPKLL
jgi:hypothetical protein